jgi:hypothetical protein
MAWSSGVKQMRNSIASTLRLAALTGALILPLAPAHADWHGGGGWHGGWGWHGGGWRGGWAWHGAGWGWHGGAWGCCWRGGVFIGLPPVYVPPPVYYPPPAYYPAPYAYAAPGY